MKAWTRFRLWYLVVDVARALGVRSVELWAFERAARCLAELTAPRDVSR